MGKDDFIISTVDELDDTFVYDELLTNPPELCIISKESACRCGLWWNRVPAVDGNTPGYIGQFYSDNHEVAQSMIELACEQLKSKGCDLAIGPMDGNTWKPYRFVTWAGDAAPFLLEPQQPSSWPDIWYKAGFSDYEHYISAICNSLNYRDPRLISLRKRMRDKGLSIRSIDMSQFETELRRVYELSVQAFSKNVLYTPISEDDFVNQYLPFADKIDPDFVLIAEDKNGECSGFFFAIPDYLQLHRGEQLDRIIYKTLAIRSDRRNAGLGSILVEMLREKAESKGFKHEIYALMHRDNPSTNLSKDSKILREYTLLKRDI